MAVCGIDHHAVRQVQIKVSQRVKLLLGELLRLTGSKEIGTAGGAYEEGVSRHDTPWRIDMVLFGNQECDVLRRVSRGVLDRNNVLPMVN